MEKKTVLFVIPILALILGLVGCGGDLTGGGTKDTYVVYATLVKNVQTDTARIDVLLTRNGDTITTATVALNNDTLETNTIGYYQTYGAGTIPVNAVYTLSLVDSTLLDRAISIRLAGAPIITNTGFRFYTGSAEAVSWTGGANADGFILATMPPASASVDTGYSAYVAVNNGTIPSEAFELGVNDRIIGMHMIYVAAYNGAPIANTFIPFDLPKLLIPGDNISGSNISGRAAGIVIGLPDSISVSNP
ncbi:MAG: hypothetical protein R3F48_17595 [Candidatus Zixiibacteriota bacterium]